MEVLVIVDVWCATTLGDLNVERGKRGGKGGRVIGKGMYIGTCM